MKLIQGLKQIKDLQRKADDLVAMVKINSAISSIETAVYGDLQAEKVKGWIQAHHDILKEILKLRISIQMTNLITLVTITLDGVQVTKSIAEWIHRRRDLASLELLMWSALTDRNLKEGMAKGPTGTDMLIQIVRFYDPSTRDEKRSLYSSEPSLIDAQLEITNAVTDIVESLS